MSVATPFALGLDFGTTNSVAAVARGGVSDLLLLETPAEPDAAFRSALCFWEDEGARGGVAAEAGPWAIAEYLAFPQGSRFLQSFKSVAANATFEHATIFEKRMKFEDLGRIFLEKMARRANGRLAAADRVVVGRSARMQDFLEIRSQREFMAQKVWCLPVFI